MTTTLCNACGCDTDAVVLLLLGFGKFVRQCFVFSFICFLYWEWACELESKHKRYDIRLTSAQGGQIATRFRFSERNIGNLRLNCVGALYCARMMAYC